MHSELAGAAAALHGLLAATTTTTASKTSSASYGPIILILLVVGAYMLFIRPQRAKLRQQQQQGTSSVNVGDEVLTTSGIIGRVQRFEGDRVVIEIAPGTNVSIYRNTLGRRIEPRDDYYPPPPPEDPPVGGSSASGDHPDAGANGDANDGPWWPGPSGDASPSPGESS